MSDVKPRMKPCPSRAEQILVLHLPLIPLTFGDLHMSTVVDTAMVVMMMVKASGAGRGSGKALG